MTKSLYLDVITKDLVVENYNLKFTENAIDYVAQKIETRLLFFKNEWYLNRDMGLPYYEDILVKNPNMDLVTSLFREAITDIDGVDEILKFDVTLESSTRKLTIDFALQINNEIYENSLEI